MNKKSTLFLMLAFSYASFASAQTKGGEPVPDKTLIRRMMEWVTIFTSYSDVDLSDKADLKQYAESADLITGFITNPELSVRIAEFRASSFVRIYPKGLIHSEESLFQKLNDVSHAQYSVMNAPYVIAEVWFTPVDQYSGYLITFNFRGSNEIKENLSTVNSAMNARLSGRKFTTPKEGKEAINEALFYGIDQLTALFGSTYAPTIAIKYNDELYTHNQTIEVWQRADGAITLEAVDRNGNPLAGAVTWTNASGTGTAAQHQVTAPGTNRVTARHGNDEVGVLVKVKEFSLNVEDILKGILMEVINEKITQARQNLEKAKEDSLNVNTQITQTQQQLDVRSGLLAAQDAPPAENFHEEDVADFRPGSRAMLDEIKRDPVKNNFIELHRQKFILIAHALLQIKIEVFLNDIIRNEGSINAYVISIRDHSPELIADLIMNLARKPENRTQIKDIVINFVNEQIDEVASN